MVCTRVSLTQAFEELGCGMVYFEGPKSVEEMREFNRRITRASTILAQVEKPGRWVTCPGVYPPEWFDS